MTLQDLSFIFCSMRLPTSQNEPLNSCAYKRDPGLYSLVLFFGCQYFGRIFYDKFVPSRKKGTRDILLSQCDYSKRTIGTEIVNQSDLIAIFSSNIKRIQTKVFLQNWKSNGRQRAKCREPLRKLCHLLIQVSFDLKFCTLFNSFGSVQLNPVYEIIIYLSSAGQPFTKWVFLRF